MANQTYREATQSLIRQIWEIYDKVGSIRDFAGWEEKDPWNEARGKLYDAAITLGRFDDKLTPERAAALLKGEY